MKRKVISIFVVILSIMALKFLWPFIVMGFKLFIVLSTVAALKFLAVLIFLAVFIILITL